MANIIAVMKRREIKYILNESQCQYIKKSLEGHMLLDQFGLCSIASLYYDTPNKRLIRASIEKQKFKEKIRLRSYGLATDDSNIFLELKRKAEGIVYKRRVTTTMSKVEKFFNKETDDIAEGQIAKEIVYFRNYYENLVPSCLIIYDREAYYEPDGDLRLTIDYNLRYRVQDLNLKTSMEGTSLLPKGYAILEIKVQDAIPLWLTKILDEGKIYKGSFSKYGEAFKQEILKARGKI